MSARVPLALLLALASLAWGAGAAAEPNECAGPSHWAGGEAEGDGYVVNAVVRSCTRTPGSDEGQVVFTERVEIPPPVCGRPDVLSQNRRCVPEESAFVCPDGTMTRNTVYTRTHTDAGVSPWVLAYGGGCPQYDEIDEQVSQYFTSVVLTPTVAGRQPEGAQGLVNMPLVVFADPAAQVMTTDLGGWSVTITATPMSYSWDLGPAGEIVTTDPGAPYPDHTVAPIIGVTGPIPVTLTTSWSGTFRVEGGMQYPINGVATTLTTLEPIEIREARNRLVADTL